MALESAVGAQLLEMHVYRWAILALVRGTQYRVHTSAKSWCSDNSTDALSMTNQRLLNWWNGSMGRGWFWQQSCWTNMEFPPNFNRICRETWSELGPHLIPIQTPAKDHIMQAWNGEKGHVKGRAGQRGQQMTGNVCGEGTHGQAYGISMERRRECSRKVCTGIKASEGRTLDETDGFCIQLYGFIQVKSNLQWWEHRDRRLKGS